jgi:hypothetical protein
MLMSTTYDLVSAYDRHLAWVCQQVEVCTYQVWFRGTHPAHLVKCLRLAFRQDVPCLCQLHVILYLRTAAFLLDLSTG